MKCFEDIYKNVFSRENKHIINFLHQYKMDEIYETAHNLVQYGWKKEAVPVIHEKKSLISRLFDKIFN